MARREPSSEERALWRAATRDVMPLGRIRRAPPDQAMPTAGGTAPAQAARPAGTAAPRRTTAQADLVLAAAPGVDRRTADRLRRGELPIAGRLDLHGMTQEQAHGALDRFLARAQDLGQRCVLVITGKGYRSGASTCAGVLRAAVPRWLNEAPNRSRLLAIAAAMPRDGGSGALYVLLRRRR